MISVYNDADFLSAYKQKKRVFCTFLAVTTVYLVFCVAWLVYHISLPYNDPMDFLPQLCVYVATAIYAVFVFPFMSIKYSRVRRYYKMLSYVCEGLKMDETNYFYTFREKSLQKDNIDVVGCVFETWSKKKCEWLEREAYADAEKTMPPFESGDLIRYITQSNFIIQYEVLQRHALEFEEEEEDWEESSPEPNETTAENPETNGTEAQEETEKQNTNV